MVRGFSAPPVGSQRGPAIIQQELGAARGGGFRIQPIRAMRSTSTGRAVAPMLSRTAGGIPDEIKPLEA